MDRRTASLTLALAPFAAMTARAQPAKIARVAWISIESANPGSPFFQSFKRGLADLGWSQGRNLVIDEWWSGGTGAPLERTIGEAASSRPDVILAAGGLVLRPLINAGVSVPVVFSYSGDAVIGGIVQSYARPGVNRSGISLFSLALVPKRLELLKDMLPSMQRVAIIGWPQHAGERSEREAAIATAGKLGLAHDFFPVSNGPELDQAFDGATRQRCDAILAFADGVTINFADRFAAFSRAQRIPSVSGWSVFAEKGNLMTYGPIISECYGRLALYVDKILKGAKAADLPVELPTTHELVINRNAASQIGIAIPSTLLARADRVIG